MFKKKNLWLWGLAGVAGFLYYRGKQNAAAQQAAVALATQQAPTASGDYFAIG